MTEEGLTTLGTAVRRRLNDLGKSQAWLGQQLGAMHDRTPYGQSTVGTWLDRTEIPPALVFDIERALELPPGQLAKLNGYLPVEAAEVVCSVPEAVAGDPLLDDRGRRSLLAAYRALVES